MKLSFHGAARCVTGTKHLLSLNNGKNILLDCGMFQGMGAQTEDLNNDFGFDAASVTYLIVSHAHIDHTGLIPKLVKDGFTGKIISTPATKDLAEILMYDSAEIQTYDIDVINRKRAAKNLKPYEPLYNSEDVTQALQQFDTYDFNQWVNVDEDVELLFTHTGHLIGSAAITLRVKEGGKQTIITFSGDVGRYNSMLLQPPAEFPQSDYIILESTYGDKMHDMVFNTVDTLRDWIRKTCHQKGGKLIIPAFSVGRTPEVLYAINQLSLENRLPELNYFVDIPLRQKPSEVMKPYLDEYNEKHRGSLKFAETPM